MKNSQQILAGECPIFGPQSAPIVASSTNLAGRREINISNYQTLSTQNVVFWSAVVTIENNRNFGERKPLFLRKLPMNSLCPLRLAQQTTCLLANKVHAQHLVVGRDRVPDDARSNQPSDANRRCPTDSLAARPGLTSIRDLAVLRTERAFRRLRLNLECTRDAIRCVRPGALDQTVDLVYDPVLRSLAMSW